jgi:hypothetical protein
MHRKQPAWHTSYRQPILTTDKSSGRESFDV